MELISLLKKSNWLSKSEIVVGLVISSLGINALSITIPLVILQLYDRIIPNRAIETLTLLLIGAIIAITLEAILKFSRAQIISQGEARVSKYFFSNYISSEISKNKKNSFNKVAKIQNIENKIRTITSNDTIGAIADTPIILLFFCMLLYANPLLFATTIAIQISFFSYILKQQRKNLKLTLLEERLKLNNKNMNYDTVGKLPTIKNFGIEEKYLSNIKNINNKSAKENFDIQLEKYNLAKNINFITQLNLTTIVCLGAWMVIQEEMSFGWLAASIILCARAIAPLSKIIFCINKINLIAITDKFLQKNNIESSIYQQNSNIDVNKIKPKITLKNISIANNISNEVILNNISIEFQPYSTNLIVGSSISTENLLLKSISGIEKPISGKISISNYEVIKIKDFINKKYLIYIDLNEEVINGSILDNLTLFDKTQEQNAINIAKSIKLDKYIKKLPNGYNTIIGNTATNHIPENIKQLIIIARGLCKTPKICLINTNHIAINSLDFIELIKYINKTSTVIVYANNRIYDKTDIISNIENVYEIQKSKLIAKKVNTKEKK